MKTESKKDLARYQEALLTTLFENQSAPAIIEALQRDLKTTPWASYLDDADPDILELAAVIFQKWGCCGGARCQHLQGREEAC
ncbi:MAG: hypothetical protein P1V97_17925 [Planctomycetota bacterium]|nr:hypothetical protein [Planctomycetota bacterium]